MLHQFHESVEREMHKIDMKYDKFQVRVKCLESIWFLQ